MVNYDQIEKQFGKYKDKKLTRQKAIRIYCKELCCANDQVSWRDCSLVFCPLWKFRKGTEIKGNLGSFHIKSKITTQKQKDEKSIGKNTINLPKNTIPELNSCSKFAKVLQEEGSASENGAELLNNSNKQEENK